MNDAAELMQRTVPLTWNKPEWMLPEAQTEIQKEFGYISILISGNDSVLPGKYSTKQMRFFDYDAEPIDAQDVEFWPICLNTQINEAKHRNINRR